VIDQIAPFERSFMGPMIDMPTFESFIPEYEKTRWFLQHNGAHIFCVRGHMVTAASYLPKRPERKCVLTNLAELTHDLGKIYIPQTEGRKKARYDGHEKISAAIMVPHMREKGYPEDETKFLEWMILNHDIPLSELRALVENYPYSQDVEFLLMHREADIRAHDPRFARIMLKRLQRIIDYFKAKYTLAFQQTILRPALILP
jgi:hypothetical protein